MRRLAAVLPVLLLFVIGYAAEQSHELSKKELKTLLSKANTDEDHLRLAKHFEAKAKRYEEESIEHAEMAKSYRSRPTASESKRPMAPDTAAHCDTIAQSLAKAAKESRALAESHRSMRKR